MNTRVVGADIRYGQVVWVAEDDKVYPVFPLDHTVMATGIAVRDLSKDDVVTIGTSNGSDIIYRL